MTEDMFYVDKKTCFSNAVLLCRYVTSYLAKDCKLDGKKCLGERSRRPNIPTTFPLADAVVISDSRVMLDRGQISVVCLTTKEEANFTAIEVLVAPYTISRAE